MDDGIGAGENTDGAGAQDRAENVLCLHPGGDYVGVYTCKNLWRFIHLLYESYSLIVQRVKWLNFFKWYGIPHLYIQFIENNNIAKSIKHACKSKMLKAD